MKKPSPQNAVVFLNILIPILLGCMVDLYAPALPSITNFFQAKLHLVQLSISLYLLGYGIGQIPLGILSDKFGRRKTMLFSTLLLIGISILATTPNNLNMLNLYRFLQGVSIAGLCVCCRAIAVDYYSDIKLTRVMNYFYISRSAGIIVAPFIGGYLLHYFGWQADFYFFAFYGAMIFALIAILTKETQPVLQAFTLRKIFKTAKEIITNRFFFYWAMILTLLYGLWMAFEVIGPFLIQTKLKYSVISYGYILTAAGITYFIGNFCNHILINYFKPLNISFFATLCILLTSIVMLLLGVLMPLNLYIILLPLQLISFLTGFIFPNLTAAALGVFKTSAGTAGAILGAFMSVGVFLISSIASIFKTNTQIPMAIIFVVLSGICVLMYAMVETDVF